MDTAAAKQQIVERVKQATNVLVTVSSNPSVDQLAACIGLTLLLNKMDKHATAVFSGKVPSTIEFLQPEKTIETNTDSLQDFIISLDKNKADKLRYKVEDDVVRVFITPYRSSITEKDLVFSQGDFNVDVVMALGIKDKSQIDQAIAAHGRILHDATVISVNAGSGDAPKLGQINWQEQTASSLCEMLVSISEAFGTGLIDNQMATAFLTGIVAETKRFSNDHTSPKVMTMAAQLMAAGANQQLIVSKLEPPAPPPPAQAKPAAPVVNTPTEGTLSLAVKAAPAEKPEKLEAISIQHDKIDINAPTEVAFTPNEIHIDTQGNLMTADGASLSAEADQPKDVGLSSAAKPMPQAPSAAVSPHALLKQEDLSRTAAPPFSADMQKEEWIDPLNPTPADVLGKESSSDSDLFQHPGEPTSEPSQMGQNAPMVMPPGPQPELPAGAATAPTGVDNARSAVENALTSAPFDPAFEPPVDALNAQPIGPELHDPGQQAPLSTQETPSFNLPTTANGAISVDVPAPPPTDNIAPPAPPPVPPPLPLNANPGAMLPNANATSQPPK